MVAKIIIVLSLAVAAYAGAVPVIPYEQVSYSEPQATAHYDYSYSVHDGHSGDIKQQQEERAGDAVHGSYSFVQPDGVRRIVHYTADKEHGYNAEVTYEGTPIHQAPAKVAVAAPVAYAQAPVSYAHAPVSYAHAPVSYAHAPVAYAPPAAYSAPVTKIAYAAPLAQVAYASPAISYHH